MRAISRTALLVLVYLYLLLLCYSFSACEYCQISGCESLYISISVSNMYIGEYVGAAVTAAASWSQYFMGSGGHHHHEDFYERNLKTVSKIYGLTVYPSAYSFLSCLLPLAPFSSISSRLTDTTFLRQPSYNRQR